MHHEIKDFFSKIMQEIKDFLFTKILLRDQRDLKVSKI